MPVICQLRPRCVQVSLTIEAHLHLEMFLGADDKQASHLLRYQQVRKTKKLGGESRGAISLF